MRRSRKCSATPRRNARKVAGIVAQFRRAAPVPPRTPHAGRSPSADHRQVLAGGHGEPGHVPCAPSPRGGLRDARLPGHHRRRPGAAPGPRLPGSTATSTRRSRPTSPSSVPSSRRSRSSSPRPGSRKSTSSTATSSSSTTRSALRARCPWRSRPKPTAGSATRRPPTRSPATTSGDAKKVIVTALGERGIPFADCGVGRYRSTTCRRADPDHHQHPGAPGACRHTRTVLRRRADSGRRHPHRPRVRHRDLVLRG